MVHLRRSYFRSFLLSLGATTLVMMPRLAAAQETRNAFVWLEFEVPTGGDFSGFSLNSVVDVNNQGRILGQVASGSSTRGFVITDEEWTMLKPTSAATLVRDMNNSGEAVGWTGTANGRKWSPLYASDGTQYTGYQIEGINDGGDLAGYDNTQSAPVGYVVGTGWVALPPLNSGNATAAYGISNGDQSNYPFIVGQSMNTGSAATWPVLWTYDGQDFTANQLDPTHDTQYDIPYFVNNDGWIVGSTDSGTTPPYDYLVWTPNGSGGWTRIDTGRSGVNSKAIGLNASNEVVSGHYLFIDDGSGGLDEYDLYDMANIPVQGEAEFYYPSANAIFRAINDSGWIVGKCKRTDDGVNFTDVVMLLVPYDMDNNGEPDYREMIADREHLDSDENWILDVAEMMRVGLQAPQSGDDIARDINKAQIVRMMRDLNDIWGFAYDTNGVSCAGQAEKSTKWGNNSFQGGSYSDQGKELTINIRSNPGDGSEHDYIIDETDEPTAEEYEQAIQCFAHRFARCIDYMQLGNEAWAGKGRFWIRAGQLKSPNHEWSGNLSDVPTGAFNEALDLMFDQLQGQVNAARRGSALAGRPLRLIGPATGWKTTLSGMSGDPDGPYTIAFGGKGEETANRCARFTQRLIEFCNDNHVYLDCHYIINDNDDFLDAVEALSDQGNAEWDVPEWLVTGELAAVPSSKDEDPPSGDYWWEAPVENSNQVSYSNKAWTTHFFDGGLLYDGIDSWEPDWQDYWLNPLNLHHDQKYTLPSDFPLDAFTELASWGYQIACFPCRQNTGDPNAAGRLDMAAIYADKLNNGSIQPDFVERWQSAFEDAAAYFQITDPNPWNPHPDACPDTPCPPCSQP